jgi:hypothetical protein
MSSIYFCVFEFVSAFARDGARPVTSTYIGSNGGAPERSLEALNVTLVTGQP